MVESNRDRNVVKARANRAAGRVVRIDLDDRRCAYGRQLTGVSVEFYNRVGTPGEPVDLLELVDTPIAFTVWVMDRAFRRGGRWELLDTVPLTQNEQSHTHRYTKQDPINKAISIYWSDPTSGAHGETPATIEECLGLERVAVWDPEHVEDRLRDHFDRRQNKWVESLRLKP
ncbi:immunity 26/phosphotriesterase HocA family protein [Antrihabitans spumae]|uniref:Immunity 26/phosphotriesterase HocA family protein n=1 Tax=Antrihabitans spumae TaxID=3373370 RepID=A0ABW7K592_9NOCA